MTNHQRSTWPPGNSEMAERIRLFDWSSTVLGPIGEWPVSLRTLVASLVLNAFPKVLLWGPDLIQIYNDGYRDLMGNKHPGGLGKPTREVWPEVWHINQPIYQRISSGESVMFEDALYPITRSGHLEDAWFTLSYSPVTDDSSNTAGVLVTVFETTKRVVAEHERRRAEASLIEVTAQARAETARRQSEARFRALVNASSDVLYRMSADWTEMRQLSGTTFLENTTDPSTTWLERYIPPDTQAEVREAIEKAIREKSVFELEHRVRLRDGGIGWTLSRAVPVLNNAGEITEWFGAASDITFRRQAEEQLRTSLAEREALLREVNHRVKNNLEVIDSLLELQADAVADLYVRELLIQASNRVHAIADVHRLLSASAELANIDMRAFAEDLCRRLFSEPRSAGLNGPARFQ